MVRIETVSGRLTIHSSGVEHELPVGRMSGGATCLTAF
jgi:hypothetical protein